MPGANYMGGRRNVMKARTKDAVGRQQKGHFGRQRLDILSKGISTTKPSEIGRAGLTVPALGKSSAQDIELAHARKKIRLDDTASVRSFIPSPIHVTPRTPWSHNRARTRASEMHIHSPNTRRSKVLEAVDLSENLFLRRIADQILAMPNLACLPDRNSSKTASKSKRNQMRRVIERPISTPISSGKRKMSSRDNSEEPDPRRKLDVNLKPVLSRCAPHNNRNPYTPPQKKQQLLKSSYSNISSGSSLYQGSDFSSREISSSFLAKHKHDKHSTEDSEVDESDFDSEGIHTIIRSSSLWSPEYRRHSSKTSVDDDAFEPNHESSIIHDDVSQVLENSSPSRNESIGQSFIQHAFGEESGYLPSAIVLGPSVQRRIGGRSSTRRPTESQTIYGSLFEKEDPWKTIGMILGLPETDNRKDSPKQLNVDREAYVSDLDQDHFWGSPPQKKIDTIAEELQVAKGEADDDEAEYVEKLETEYEWEVQSPTMPNDKRIADDELEIHNHFNIAELPFPGICVNIDYSPSVQDEEDNTIDVDQWGAQETEVVALGCLEEKESLGISLIRATTTTSVNLLNCQDSEEMPRPIVPDGVGEYVMDVGGSHHGGSAEGGDKILGTPELRELNGRFLGPSLFDDFDESEEEC